LFGFKIRSGENAWHHQKQAIHQVKPSLASMKGALTSLLLAIALLMLLYWKSDVFLTAKTIDIHLHDTYYIVSYKHLAAALFLFLGTFFSLGGLIRTRARSRLFLVLTILFVAVDAYCLIEMAKAFRDA
jgi:hypothetical protein